MSATNIDKLVMRKTPSSILLLCASLNACSESHGQRRTARNGDASSSEAPDAEATYDSGAKFDFSGADIIQFNRPIEQNELAPPRMFDTGCERCNGEEFCDLDHCAVRGRGGTAYVGGTYGWECDEEPLDPRLKALCGGSLCVDGLCVSCRADSDCCRNDPSCVPSDWVCLWWSRVQSNQCLSVRALNTRNIMLPAR